MNLDIKVKHKINISFNTVLFAWKRIFSTEINLKIRLYSERPRVRRGERKISSTWYIACDIASFTDTTPRTRDAPKPLTYSLSISRDAAKWWCISGAAGLFFLLKSWGVKTGMSWLDTLFNLSLSPPRGFQSADSLPLSLPHSLCLPPPFWNLHCKKGAE